MNKSKTIKLKIRLEIDVTSRDDKYELILHFLRYKAFTVVSNRKSLLADCNIPFQLASSETRK